MNEAYVFTIGILHFILNIQHSTIGYGYPRLFAEFPNGDHINVDFTVGQVFGMSQSDWDSWLDGTEILLETEEAIQKKIDEAGIIKWNNLLASLMEVAEKKQREV